MARGDLTKLEGRLHTAATSPRRRSPSACYGRTEWPCGQGSIALDGKTLRGSFDKFNDRAAAQVLSAFATDTTLVLAHIDIAAKSNEIPAAQALLAELGLAPGAIVGGPVAAEPKLQFSHHWHLHFPR